MKPHRTDTVSLVFGALFLTVAGWWLAARLMDLRLPAVGWFLAAALILIGLFGLVGVVRATHTPATSEAASTSSVATPEAAPTPSAATSSWAAPAAGEGESGPVTPETAHPVGARERSEPTVPFRPGDPWRPDEQAHGEEGSEGGPR